VAIIFCPWNLINLCYNEFNIYFLEENGMFFITIRRRRR
jgi:hypothetical protein